MFDDRDFMDPTYPWNDNPTFGFYYQDPMFLAESGLTYAPDYAPHHKPVRFDDHVDNDPIDPKFEGGIVDRDYVNRSLAGPVKKIKHWRTGTGDKLRIDKMETSHLLNCVRMLWRLNYGSDAKDEPYREEYIGPLSLELERRNHLDQLGPEILSRTRFVYLLRQAKQAQ